MPPCLPDSEIWRLLNLLDHNACGLSGQNNENYEITDEKVQEENELSDNDKNEVNLLEYEFSSFDHLLHMWFC